MATEWVKPNVGETNLHAHDDRVHQADLRGVLRNRVWIPLESVPGFRIVERIGRRITGRLALLADAGHMLPTRSGDRARHAPGGA